MNAFVFHSLLRAALPEAMFLPLFLSVLFLARVP